MSESTVVELRPGAYHDSVTLLQVSRPLAARRRGGGRAGRHGHRAQSRRAAQRWASTCRPSAGPNDLVVAVRADRRRRRSRRGRRGTRRGADRGRPAARRRRPGAAGAPPRTVGAAAAAHAGREPRPGLGPRPARVRRGDGRARGRAVACWCSATTCPSTQEVPLKDEAARRGLLVMGPDCGTAVVGGVGLGFANVVRPGPGRAGRGVRHRRAAGDVPARRRRGRRQALPRRRRARPVRRRRRPIDAAGARAARRRPGDRAHRPRVASRRTPEVAGARSRRRRRRSARRCCSALLGPGRPTSPTVAPAGGARRSASTWREPVVAGTVQPAPAARRRRCAGCSRAAPCATRR